MVKQKMVDGVIITNGRAVRKQIRAKVWQCFRQGQGVSERLLRQARELDVFGHWKPMKRAVAVAVIASLANASKKEQYDNPALFQAWFTVGNHCFWETMLAYRRVPVAVIYHEPVILARTSQSKRYIPSELYHMTARRDGCGRRMVSCPRCLPCARY